MGLELESFDNCQNKCNSITSSKCNTDGSCSACDSDVSCLSSHPYCATDPFGSSKKCVQCKSSF